MYSSLFQQYFFSVGEIITLVRIPSGRYSAQTCIQHSRKDIRKITLRKADWQYLHKGDIW